MIYLDNAATTKALERCSALIKKYNEDEFFNPSSSFRAANKVSNDIDLARKTFINLLGGQINIGKIIFTSGATEANNLAVLGSAIYKQKTYVFSEGEHPSVYEAALHLKNNGYNVLFIPLCKEGTVDYEKLKNILHKDVCFVSMIAVNNETGAINNIKKIKNIMNEKCPTAVLHVDAVQEFGKLPSNVLQLGIDLCSMSAHKIHGPKGIGALFVGPKINIKNINYGGGQEGGLRSGTQNVAGIHAFIGAAREMHNNLDSCYNHVVELRKEFLNGLSSIEGKYKINGDGSAYILSLSIKGIRGETLVHMLAEHEIYISTGSACSSSKIGNRVLAAMGINKEEVLGSVRISFSYNNTIEEVKIAANEFCIAVNKLLSLRG